MSEHDIGKEFKELAQKIRYEAEDAVEHSDGILRLWNHIEQNYVKKDGSEVMMVLCHITDLLGFSGVNSTNILAEIKRLKEVEANHVNADSLPIAICALCPEREKFIKEKYATPQPKTKLPRKLYATSVSLEMIEVIVEQYNQLRDYIAERIPE